MKKIIKKLFNWIFKEDLEILRVEISKAKYFANETKKRLNTFDKVLSGIDVSVDVHEHDNRYSPSWAVVSLQGQKTDYIKFVELGQSEINEIARFLRHFERNSNIKVDASPLASRFLRVPRSKRF